MNDSSAYWPIHLPCGSRAEFDHGSGCSFRCTTCQATVGSAGMPKRCSIEIDKYTVIEALGGLGWDYDRGQPRDK